MVNPHGIAARYNPTLPSAMNSRRLLEISLKVVGPIMSISKFILSLDGLSTIPLKFGRIPSYA